MKYIIVTGGLSGLGKGITSSSIGLLLQSQGINLTHIKIDGYLNQDAGLLSPSEHGECYVLDDKSETDLDMGNYYRFTSLRLTYHHNITSGKIYQSVINKERHGVYLGRTVQVIPTITDEITAWIKHASHIPVNANNDIVPEVCIVEVGGCISDCEIFPYLESLRQLSQTADDNGDQFCFVHVSLIVDLGEPKTKPTQEGVAKLRSLGISPDILVLRYKEMLPPHIIKKLKTFCQVKEERIITSVDAKNIYYVPDIFKQQGICEQICKILDIKMNDYKLDEYYKILDHFNNIEKLKTLNLAISGKYTGSPDTYLSLIRAVEHASFKCGVNINIIWIDTEKTGAIDLDICSGVIIPGGFGVRGINGKLAVCRYARENNIPILGICLGFQIMVTDCWHLANNNIPNHDIDPITLAGSTEWDPNTIHKIVDILPLQTGLLGGTMRLGSYTTNLQPDSKVAKLYNSEIIEERHRHRYEVNNNYLKDIQKSGLVFSGVHIGESCNLMEIAELPENQHPFYIGCQFHPEYKSRYDNPHPLFVGLIEAMINYDNSLQTIT